VRRPSIAAAGPLPRALEKTESLTVVER